MDDSPIAVLIPKGLKIEDVMKSLSIGHGYDWLVLVREPVLVAGGIPITEILPELLLVHRKLWILKEDAHHLERLEHTLDRLNGGWSSG